MSIVSRPSFVIINEEATLPWLLTTLSSYLKKQLQTLDKNLKIVLYIRMKSENTYTNSKEMIRFTIDLNNCDTALSR